MAGGASRAVSEARHCWPVCAGVSTLVLAVRVDNLGTGKQTRRPAIIRFPQIGPGDVTGGHGPGQSSLHLSMSLGGDQLDYTARGHTVWPPLRELVTASIADARSHKVVTLRSWSVVKHQSLVGDNARTPTGGTGKRLTCRPSLGRHGSTPSPVRANLREGLGWPTHHVDRGAANGPCGTGCHHVRLIGRNS